MTKEDFIRAKKQTDRRALARDSWHLWYIMTCGIDMLKKESKEASEQNKQQHCVICRFCACVAVLMALIDCT